MLTRSYQDAQAALTRYNSFEKFTISSKPVTADYIHAGVFVPVFNVSEETERFMFSPLGNTATKLAYWDEDAWASELVVSTASPKLSSAVGEGQVRSAADQAAAAAENEGLLKPGKEADTKVKKRKAETSTAAKQKKVLLHSPFNNQCRLTRSRLHLRTCNSGVIAMQSFMA